MKQERAFVIIVDDDSQLLKYVERLVKSIDLDTLTFSSAQEFLDHGIPDAPCCLVLDVRMPGVSGISLHSSLVEKGINIPVIFLTAHANVDMGVEAIKRGALDFIEKPFEDQRFLDSVQEGVRIARTMRAEDSLRSGVRDRYESLTRREKEVFQLVTEGLPNKHIAHRMGISEKTVKVHRGRIMAKMEAGSIASLVKMSEMIDVKESASGR